MAAVPMAKIVLKNTTKMSLNERFTAYRQQAQSTVNNIRQKMQLQRQASLENRRLAQQMANRPSVIAALRLKKRSLQQRLGQKRLGQGTVSSPTSRGNVKARLNLNVRQNVSSVQGRLGGQRSNRGRGAAAARRGVKRTNRNGTVRSGTSPMLKARLGSQNTSRYGYGSSYRQNQNRGGNYRRGRGGYNRNRRQTRNNFRGQYRRGGGAGGNNRGRSGQARGGGGGGGGGWSRGAGRKIVPTKQELDNQLDEYMAETKSHLDAELDAYMAQGE